LLRRRNLVAIGFGALVFAGGGLLRYFPKPAAVCGPGFTPEGPRCIAHENACPAPLLNMVWGCDEPIHDVVLIPPVSVQIGPSDWEAEGRVKPQLVKTNAFYIDRLEVTEGRYCRWKHSPCTPDAARAVAGVSYADAAAYCKDRDGFLPTHEQWIAAAAGDKPRRYPWGDTGAVCRRAAWGLDGQCARGADGPDTVGAHPDGATPLGVHDLAGNVAEWVNSEPPATRGGSWKSNLATELRTWPAVNANPNGDATTGFRCAYSAVR
jgi:formylglycine-generating enzyme required for sulfatase activity